MFRAKLIPVTAFAMLLAASACAAEAAAAAPRAEGAKDQFLRLARDRDNRPLRLETAIVRCAPVDGNRRTPTVDLVAAIHVADAAYYRQLNREFAGYDAVLYELVAAEEAQVPRPGSPPGNNPLSLLQNGIKNVLDLEFQLDGIDYTRKNMVHADMSPAQFARSMQDRGETMLGMVARMIGYALTQQNRAADAGGSVQLLAALLDKNRATALKRIVAEQFVDNGDALTALEGPNGSTLISGRNQVALSVLRKEIAAGKQKIAVFYGAGHMPDLARRLRADFGLTPVDTRWLTAWNLKP